MISIYLIIGKRSVLVDSVHLGDFAAHRFTLEYGFLFSFGEQWYLVVNILQHDVYSCLGSQLLSSIILVGLSFGRDYKTIVHISYISRYRLFVFIPCKNYECINCNYASIIAFMQIHFSISSLLDYVHSNAAI